MTTPAPLQIPGAALAALDPADFDAVVRSALSKGADEAVWESLTDPAVVVRTRAALAAIHTDVQNQLQLSNESLEQAKAEGMLRGETGKAAYLAAKAEQREWRRKVLFFRRVIEQRLAFVKARMPQTLPGRTHMPYGPGETKNARRQNRLALEQLARAVAAHRDKVLSGDGSEGDDDDLWDSLDKVTAVTRNGDEMPLAEWLGYLDDLREADEEGDER